ncbi:MAG: hypothetical protein IJZ93_00890 [Clostridia bacterium]|nr:hypothetical protein [Clostridia bacterium]
MNEKLLEPLKYYETQGRATHERNITEHFDKLLAQSGVNVEANRSTVKAYNAENHTVTKIEGKISKYKVLKVFLIIAIVIGAICAIIGVTCFSSSVWLGIGLLAFGAVAVTLSIICIVKKINPVLKKTSELLDYHRKKASELLAEAERQMSPLNALFDERDTISLIEKTIPEINFEDTYTKEQEELFKKHYDFIDLESEECSMVNALSGKLDGNPFLFCRCLLHELKSATYHGSLVISWTETYRDSKGHVHTRRRTQTLHASLTKPKPFYHYNNYLAYGSQAAPDLIFSRAPQVSDDMDEEDIEKKVRKGEKKLKKKAQKALARGESFQEMANSEFDVLFGAANRNNEVQFRLMYTPLAQRNTVSLIVSDTGYGDDFYFTKHNKFNIITSNHAQSWNMNTSPQNYYSYDVDEARKKFTDFNNNYFKSVFFDFAPLLSVPAYLEEPCASLEMPEAYISNYPYYEHETVANAFNLESFLPYNSIGYAILKTDLVEKQGDADIISVTANSYTTMDHIEYVPVPGGDGRIHGVPVHWTEYIPAMRTRSLRIYPTDMTRKEYSSKRMFDPDLRNSALLHGLIGTFID